MTSAPIDLLRLAQSSLAQGDLWRADGAARLHLLNVGSDPAAEALRTHVAASLGLTGWRDQATPPDLGKHLLIQACGAGFWSDIAHVLAGLLLAEITGRSPIVHWGANSRFRAPGMGDRDAFGQFFAPIGETPLAALEAVTDRWPADWPLNPPAVDAPIPNGCSPIELLARRESLVVAPRFLPLADLADWTPRSHRFFGLTKTEIFKDLMAQHLIVQPEIQAAARSLLEGPLCGRPFFSAHVRGTDKKNEVPNNDALITAYLLWADRMMQSGERQLFLATDDQRFAGVFRDRFGERLVLAEATRRSDAIGVHAEPGDMGYRLGVEVLVDCLVAAEGERFAGNGLSGPSCAIALMRRRPPATCTLFAENLWLREDMALLLL